MMIRYIIATFFALFFTSALADLLPWGPPGGTGSTVPTVTNITVPLTVDPSSSFSSVVFSLASGSANCSTYRITSSSAGNYGSLDAGISNAHAYTTYTGLSAVNNLPTGQTLNDTFTFDCAASDGTVSSTATLTIQIIGNANVSTSVPTVTNKIIPLTIDPKSLVTSVPVNASTGSANCGQQYQITSSYAGTYGSLSNANTPGNYSYILYADQSKVKALPTGQMLTDSFTYTCSNSDGTAVSAPATITIQLIGNQTTTATVSYDNVDIEFNDTFAKATPLNSSRTILGSLYGGNDRDWYSLSSSGDEILTIELCPTGSVCEGNHNWVVYIFDSATLTKAMETTSYPLRAFLKETGTTDDLSGAQRVTSPYGKATEMYLQYWMGAYQGALVGIIDPCFPSTDGTLQNSVSVGVGSGARDYFIAISPALKGDGSSTFCGQGNLFLQKDNGTVSGLDTDGLTSKTYTIVREFLTVFPYTADQYAVKVTGTGVNPLLSVQAKASSSFYSTTLSGSTFSSNFGTVSIPKVRVGNDLYQVELSQTQASKANFSITYMSQLPPDNAVDPYQATFNPANNQLLIPRVTDEVTGLAYSVIMTYHPTGQWLELSKLTLIQ